MTTHAPRHFDSPHQSSPRTHLLSNGRYSVMLTAAGSGFSKWRDIAVTRWREDATCDPWGCYIFVRDVQEGRVWSAGYQPAGVEPDSYGVDFSEDRVEFLRSDSAISTRMEVLVSGDDDIEVRRVSLTNHGQITREIELTSYAEMVLAPLSNDAAHPAFSKMFIQTHFVAEHGTLLATRRPRDAGESGVWAAHFSTVDGPAIGGLQYETDRARFLGRGHDLRNAAAVVDAGPLSNTVGTVLDPVLSLRRRVHIEPGGTVRVSFWTGVAGSRDAALTMARIYAVPDAFDDVGRSAAAAGADVLRLQGIRTDEAMVFQEIATRALYTDSSLRAPREVLAANTSGQPGLWALGISGDLPLMLVRTSSVAGAVAPGAVAPGAAARDLVEELLRAQEYWRCKGLTVDLVVLNDDPDDGNALLHEALQAQIAAKARPLTDGESARGKVMLEHTWALPAVTLVLLQTAARAILDVRRGSLRQQAVWPPAAATRRHRHRETAPASSQQLELQRAAPALDFFNGLGGFSADGREYVISLGEGQWTPAPWVNVIANPQFGFLASADGTGSTWSLNAQQNQITPWCNDPVSNTPAEVIYVRDEGSGDLWSATALPIRQPSCNYVVRHGFGYTQTEQLSQGISLQLRQFVPLEDPIKIATLQIVNRSGEHRRLSVTHYVEWVLGNQRSRAAPYIITSIEPNTGALLARNPWNADYPSQVAFMDLQGLQHAFTGDRAGFLGRHGSLAEPAALLGLKSLSNRVGAGLDPCGALQATVELAPDASIELRLLLGVEQSEGGAAALVARYRDADLHAVFKEVTDFWDRTLSVVQVKTPDRSMDLLLNGWLLYQTLACRVWARSGFYQSSGAFGFRDQLQDVMALCVSAPAIAREHILRSAARQFTAGDVQHWWLPTTGQGIKTRISDNRIWLAFVVARYLEVTEDFAVLDELVPFLAGGPLRADQHEEFAAPAAISPASLYEHCVRALDCSLRTGAHGLPLFGSGDWNDGMNRVGAQGRGESVWLGWFLHTTLMRFAPLAERRADVAKAAQWRQHALALQRAIEQEAWDGDWYRRGYFDDGTPLGSVTSDECRIDSIAQSWAVMSGAGERSHAVRAMSAVNAQLVSRSDGLIKLFTPPFDHTSHDPGYVKAYPPGLRENGGQYTHAAVWTVIAFTMLEDGDRATELFSLLNPINHASTRAGIYRYKVEPYVICADVYSAPDHIGRGGWTWYTGSAGWMYRAGIESILGVNLRGNTLTIDPCIPRAWSGFELTFKHGSSRYRIEIKNRRGVGKGRVHATLDGHETNGEVCELALVDDGRYHYAKVTLV
jgi:cyclic beta-1,2-glucan synthetase